MPAARTLLVFWDRSGDAAARDTQAEAMFSVCQSLSEQGYAYQLGWPEGGTARFAEAGSTEELLRDLPLLLRGGAEPLQETGALRGFGKILYFTASPKPGLAQPDGGCGAGPAAVRRAGAAGCPLHLLYQRELCCRAAAAGALSMKRTNGFQLERAPAGGQTLPPWAAALCGGLCAAGALTLLAGPFPVLPAWAALLLGLLLGAGLALLPQRAWLTPALCCAAALFCLCAYAPVTAGLRQLADCVRRWLTARTGYIYLTSSGGMRQGLWAFLPLGFLSALASGRCARRGSVWFAAVSLPLAAVGCAIGLFPSCWGLLLLAGGMTALLLFRTDRGTDGGPAACGLPAAQRAARTSLPARERGRGGAGPRAACTAL